ncbi:hypothetical protein ACVW19_005525 [Streptomyces sp. TE5632]
MPARRASVRYGTGHMLREGAQQIWGPCRHKAGDECTVGREVEHVGNSSITCTWAVIGPTGTGPPGTAGTSRSGRGGGVMDKVVAAVADIHSGSTPAVGGFGLCGIPAVLIRALLEAGVDERGGQGQTEPTVLEAAPAG